MYAEELVAITDHAARGTSHPEAINRARLRIDSRKWVLSKLLPNTYGNRVEPTGELEVPPTKSQGDRIRPHAAAAAAGYLEFIAAVEFLQTVTDGDSARQIPLECERCDAQNRRQRQVWPEYNGS
jgi:hypothetical protein